MTADGQLGDGHDLAAAAADEPLAVLLIEDSPADSRLLQERLRDAIHGGEMTLQVVRRYADAVEALRRMKFSCALVDLGLPDSRGLDTLTALRKLDPELAIVVLTGHDSDALAQQIIALDFEDYLVKGRDDVGSLLRRMRFAVQHHRRKRERAMPAASAAHGLGRDAVSGLPNRALFDDRAACALAQAESVGAGVTLLSIGVDGAPLDADDVIRAIAAVIGSGLRKSDSVARLAHGEYAVLLAPTDVRFDAIGVARRLDAALRAITVEGVALQSHIGIACHPEDGTTTAALQEHAEQAMFRAQRDGLGVCRYADAACAATPLAAASSEHWTGTPLDRLSLRYQPWFDTASGRPAGVEVQWTAADAKAWEQAGPALRHTASMAMLDCALASLQRWHTAGAAVPCLAWTAAAAWLAADDAADMVGDCLDRHGLPASALRVQIDAETVATMPLRSLLDALTRLRACGCRLALTGFPGGDDRLAMLTDLPLDAVHPRAARPDDEASGRLRALHATIGACMALGIEVVATRVDQAEQRAWLAAAGVRLLQGDAGCPPLDASELQLVWLSARAA